MTISPTATSGWTTDDNHLTATDVPGIFCTWHLQNGDVWVDHGRGVEGTQPSHPLIDVPGIFRTATSRWTTDEDITLVRSMAQSYMNENHHPRCMGDHAFQSYMKSPRTIILAVVPCNVDIATQEIVTMAQAFDPEGVQTMSVLTKRQCNKLSAGSSKESDFDTVAAFQSYPVTDTTPSR
ncbi:interferon-induced gtp-binding protein mx1 [Colletotrichum asianum]